MLADVFARLLDFDSSRMINQAANGDLKSLTPQRCLELFGEMAVKTKSWARKYVPRGSRLTISEIQAEKEASRNGKLLSQEVEQDIHLLHLKVDALVHQMSQMPLAKPTPPAIPVQPRVYPTTSPKRRAPMEHVLYCESCGYEGHDASSCQASYPDVNMQGDYVEEVDYVQGNYNQGGFPNNRLGGEIKEATMPITKGMLKGSAHTTNPSHVKVKVPTPNKVPTYLKDKWDKETTKEDLVDKGITKAINATLKEAKEIAKGIKEGTRDKVQTKVTPQAIMVAKDSPQVAKGTCKHQELHPPVSQQRMQAK
ncbi:hypothetical protein LINGRAHAP2_LOCUS7305 [Linum grandiflorum]